MPDPRSNWTRLAVWFSTVTTSRRPSGAFLAGTLAGLAGLAHLYGLFWIAALGLDHIAGPAVSGDEPDRSRIWRLLAGALLPCGLWAAYALSHWSDLRAQMWINRREFDLTRAGFFIESLLNEAHRYALGVRHPETLLRAGFWLLVLGVPAALVWLSARAFGRRSDSAHALTTACPGEGHVCAGSCPRVTRPSPLSYGSRSKS